MRLENIYEAALIFVTILTLILQMYAFCVMLLKSPKSMSEYGKLLAFITAWDMIFNIFLGFGITPGLFFPAPGMYFTGFAQDIYKAFGYTSARICVGCLNYETKIVQSSIDLDLMLLKMYRQL